MGNQPALTSCSCRESSIELCPWYGEGEGKGGRGCNMIYFYYLWAEHKSEAKNIWSLGWVYSGNVSYHQGVPVGGKVLPSLNAHNWCKKCIKIYLDLHSHKYQLCLWVPAHKEMDGNDRAHYLAELTFKKDWVMEITLSISEIKSFIKNHVKSEWQIIWKERTNHPILYINGPE